MDMQERVAKEIRNKWGWGPERIAAAICALFAEEREARSSVDGDIASLADCINTIARQAGTGEAESATLNPIRDAMWRVEYRRLAWQRRAEAAEAREAKLVEALEEVAGMDCAKSDKYIGIGPCGVCISCKARAALASVKDG